MHTGWQVCWRHSFTKKTSSMLIAFGDSNNYSDFKKRTHHFGNHHDVRSSLLVDSQDVEESHVPEDDIETINCPARDEGIPSTQPQAKADKEGHNGQKVRHIEIVTEPHLYLLTYFACFRHKHLGKKGEGGEIIIS